MRHIEKNIFLLLPVLSKQNLVLVLPSVAVVRQFSMKGLWHLQRFSDKS